LSPARQTISAGLLLFVALGGLFICSSAAADSTPQALPLLTYRWSAIANVGVGGTVVAKATCPLGYIVPAGGFHIERTGAVVNRPHVYDTHPENNIIDRDWVSAALNPTTLSARATLQSFIVCLRRPTSGTLRNYLNAYKKSIDVPPASLATQVARCPAGFKVIGGGFDVDGSTLFNRPLTVVGSFPTTNNGWAARVFNPPGSPAISLEVWAMCLVDDFHEITYISASTPLPRTSVRTAEAECPAGMRIIGGGFCSPVLRPHIHR
jgi:hypothetical protein